MTPTPTSILLSVDSVTTEVPIVGDDGPTCRLVQASDATRQQEWDLRPVLDAEADALVVPPGVQLQAPVGSRVSNVRWGQVTEKVPAQLSKR